MNSMGMISQGLGDELLLLDTGSAQCHLLSEPARYVYTLAETGLSEAELVEAFEQRYPECPARGPEVVRRVLDYLETSSPEQHEAPAEWSPHRRQVLQVAGLLLITTALMPLPSQAASGNTLTLLSAVYSGPDSINCPGPNVGAASVNVLPCLQSFQGPTSISGTTFPGGCNPTLGVADPIVGTRKSLIISYRCGAGPVQQSVSCDFDGFSIVCP